MSRLKFIGGQEDGNYLEVDDCLDFIRVPENQKPETGGYVGSAKPNNHTFRLLTYVRRGDVMVYDS